MAQLVDTNKVDPGAREFVRVYRRLVDPQASIDQASIDALASEIDRVTATALYCDRLGLPDDFAQRLDRLAERSDEYALPHAMMATGWAIENRCLGSEVAKGLRDRQVKAAEGRLAQRAPGAIRDAPIETVSILYYLGERSHVKAEWVEAVLDAQLESGGWANGGASADDHTTALALWVLLEAAHPEVQQMPWIPRG